MRQQAEEDVTRQQRRLAKLTDERTKLLHAYYQGAIPLDLLHQEQERISTQTAAAEAQLHTAQRSASDVQATLQRALDLLAAGPDAHSKAPGHLRRQWNQALFLRLLVHDEDIHEAEIAEPSPRLQRQTSLTNSTATSRSRATRRGGASRTAPPLLTAAVQIRVK